MKEAKEKGNPVGGPAISINLDPRDLSNTGPPNRQHTPADMRPPTHLQKKPPGLYSFRDDAPNLQETLGPREFRGQVGWRMRTSMWRQQGGEEIWDVESSESG